MFLPGRSIIEPSGSTEPVSFHGPCRKLALALRIFSEVENLKYFPSSRCITAGSRIFLQAPAQSPGKAKALAQAPKSSGRRERVGEINMTSNQYRGSSLMLEDAR